MDIVIVRRKRNEELLRLGGKYAGLYDVQSKYYREGDAVNE